MSDTVEKIRAVAMALSASERASLAHELILSLENPDDLQLSPEQEAEIQRRVQSVLQEEATGRAAEDVLADVKAEHRE